MNRAVTATALEGVLNDYKIHLTGYDPTSREGLGATANIISNPRNWPTDHHRIPNYRPIDRNRDAESRPNATGFEWVFLTIMFSGVAMNATAAKIWGATGGPYLPRLFMYAIGGEW